MSTASRDSGETLVETVISLMMFGLAGLMVLGGLGAGSVLSSDHRTLVQADVTLKRVAEAVKLLDYASGAGDSTYDVAETGAPTAEVGPVRCWPGGSVATVDLSTFTSCSSDAGLQAVTVTVSSTDGRIEESTVVFKRQDT